MNSRPASPRRLVALLAATALAVSGIAVSATSLTDHSREGTYADVSDVWAQCDEIIVEVVPGAPDGCAHADEPPMGVDLDEYVPTSVLEKREGGAAAAVAAAEDEGVPVPAQVAAASNEVECDGDGTSGYRTQAIYMVTADKPNRFADLEDDIQQWAAGVDTVFNLSAAKTGGVRNVRYVTEDNGDGTCSAKVLNVTVPAGSFASFNSSITALQNLGYNNPARKYLMWVDGSGFGICGIALTYPYSTAGQNNPNNGAYPQYARTDAPCWGGGGTATTHSVEAHELAHTMGSVFADAPHGTNNGHCYDESDTMCYADGGGKAMQQICATDQEHLLDCNNDDYYSTFPAGGSWLATHWNAADSRFLIGGGDGNGGGDLGAPTTLGGTLAVNNPVIAGLPTQAAVELEVPAGRTATVAWKSTRRDCAFSDAAAEQTTITCDAKTASKATVTATITDSTGAKIVRTSALTFSTTARTAQPTLQLDGSAATTYTACPSGKGILTTKVVDVTTGVGLKGVSVSWTKTVGTKTSVAGTAVTAADGVATSKPIAMAAATYAATTKATTVFPAVAAAGDVDVTVGTGTCTTALTSEVEDDDLHAGDSIVVTGDLTRTLSGGSAVAAAGEKITILGLPGTATKWKSVGSATTRADGSFTATIKAVETMKVQAQFKARTGFAASVGAEIPVTVTPRATTVTGTLSADEVMAGTPVTVTGLLTQTVGSGSVPLPSAKVQVSYPLPDGKTGIVNVTSKKDGTYTATIKQPVLSGTVTIKHVAKPGWSESSTTRSLTVNEWTSDLTMAAVRNASTGAVTVTGLLSVTDEAGSTVPKGSVKVLVTYQYNATTTKTGTATTKGDGSYILVVKPLASGDVTAKFAGLTGWAAAEADPVTITVP